MKVIFALFFLSITPIALAKNIGVFGETFPVAEMSMLDWITAQRPKVDLHAFVDMATNYAARPNSLRVSHVASKRTFTYRPEVTLQNDIFDEKGQVLWKKGTTVNALHELPSYQPNWLFIDGEDAKQVQWAIKKMQDTSKIILVGGSVQVVEELIQREIYFDQNARIIYQLGITHVPAEVTRQGEVLLIQEEPLS